MPSTRLVSRSVFFPAVLLLTSLLATTCFAAPTLQSISLRGLQMGQAIKVVFTGAELQSNPRVMIDGAIPPQKIIKAEANRLEMEINVAASAPGIRHLRIATDTGVTNAMAIGVDDLPQLAFAEKLPSLPVSLTGALTGGQILNSTFTGKKGQRVVAEVESRRLGANSRIVLRILDARGAQLSYDTRNNRLAGDARCEVVLPQDGTYTIRMHDVLYKGPSPGHFRLKIGDLKSLDLPMPLAVASGATTEVSFLGAKAKVVVDAAGMLPGDAVSLGAPGWQSTAGVIVSAGAELTEKREAGKPQTLSAAPVGVTGVLQQGEREDRYLLPVKPGDRLRFEVFARRVGSPLDGVLTIRGEKGNQLARNDDQNTTSDPRVDYTVPKNVDKLLIGVGDIRQRGGGDFIYRVAVQSLARPDFRLMLVPDRMNVPAGGVLTMRAEVARTAFNGPIALRFPNLPKEVEVAGDRIEAGANFTILTLTSRHDKPYAAELKVVGKAVGVEPPLERVARLKTPPAYAAAQPWLVSTLAVSGSPANPFRISWADDPHGELKTHLGGDHDIKINIDRNDKVMGDVRFKLLATQVIPKKKVKQNNKEVTIDDLDRALRLPGDAKAVQADKQYTTKLLVPADLPDRVWSVIVMAELLSPQTKKPIATAFTNARPLRRVQPISLESENGVKIDARAGEGESGALKGKVVRVKGFNKPITVTLEGLPKGYKAPEVVVAPDKTEFELPVRFDAKAKPAELKNIRLVGLYRPNPKNPALAVKTNAATVTINVVAAEAKK